MPLSITASRMATCHGVIQCKLEFDTTEHNVKKDSFEKNVGLYCLEGFICFCAKFERNFKTKSTVKKHTNREHDWLNFMKTLPNMIICLKTAVLHKNVDHLHRNHYIVSP